MFSSLPDSPRPSPGVRGHKQRGKRRKWAAMVVIDGHFPPQALSTAALNQVGDL